MTFQSRYCNRRSVAIFIVLAVCCCIETFAALILEDDIGHGTTTNNNNDLYNSVATGRRQRLQLHREKQIRAKYEEGDSLEQNDAVEQHTLERSHVDTERLLTRHGVKGPRKKDRQVDKEGKDVMAGKKKGMKRKKNKRDKKINDDNSDCVCVKYEYKYEIGSSDKPSKADKSGKTKGSKTKTTKSKSGKSDANNIANEKCIKYSCKKNKRIITHQPMIPPTIAPSLIPTTEPTSEPTLAPTISTDEPTSEPTLAPTISTDEPTSEPTSEPTVSTESPTSQTDEPTPALSDEPTNEPTLLPTMEPTAFPIDEPTDEPTVLTLVPTSMPTTDKPISTDTPTSTPTTKLSDKPISTNAPTSQCPGKEGTIADIAAGNPDFSILVQALTAADLVDALEGPGPFTVFAPPNNAFLSLPDGALDYLLLPENKQLLTNILLYHVVPGYYQRNDFISGDLMTLYGETVVIEVTATGVLVNDASIIIPNIEACNGIIQVIDKVLLIPGLFTTAPTSSSTTVPTFKPTTTKPISSITEFPTTFKPTSAPTSLKPTSVPTSNQTIFDIALGNPDFSILVQALTAANLVDDLNEPGTLTVFGPPNSAFLSLPNGTLDNLLLPQNILQLENLLLYHVLPELYMSYEFDSREYDTLNLNGDPVSVEVLNNGTVKVNTAVVVVANIMASNGVIHVVDQVLLPPTTNSTTRRPTRFPTSKPTTSKPATSTPTTIKPTSTPTSVPTSAPTTTKPTSRAPTKAPTSTPSSAKPSPTPFASSINLVPSPVCLPGYTCLQNSDFGESDLTRYNIDLVLEMSAIADYRDAYIKAVTKWMAVIIGDMPSSIVNTTADNRVGNCTNVPTNVDDLHICGQDKIIDGPGKVVGYAGPLILKRNVTTNKYVAQTGQMTFDTVDLTNLISQGKIDDVILHEMGHVIGIGTMWDLNNLTDANKDYRVGTKATSVWQNDWGCIGTPPVEKGFNPGTQFGHWDENCFGNELMTGIADKPSPFSILTIASVEDLGYNVNYKEADEFDKDDLNSTCCKDAKMTNNRLLSSPALSDAGWAEAVAFGQSILDERGVSDDEELLLLEVDDFTTYVGDRIVFVLFEEKGHLYEVLVTI